MAQIIGLWTFAGMLSYILIAICSANVLTRKFNIVITTLVYLAFYIIGQFLGNYLYAKNLFDDTRFFIVLTILISFVTIGLYKENIHAKIFVVVSTSTLALLSTFMFCGTSDSVLGKYLGYFDEKLGAYTVENIELFIYIKSLVMIVICVIYIKCLAGVTRKMIENAKDKLRYYLPAPVISLTSLLAIMYVTNAIGIIPSSKHFLTLYANICLIFILEYGQIYASINWASQLLSANDKMRTDALTGLLNKFAFLEAEQQYNKSIKEGNAWFAIVILDLNYLKVINDTFGHEGGDNALIKISKNIQQVFEGHKCYRIGGDEFAVIIDNRLTDIDKLLAKFNKLNGKYVINDKYRISAAVGYAIYRHENTFDDVFNVADRYMYKNKVKMKAVRK